MVWRKDVAAAALHRDRPDPVRPTPSGLGRPIRFLVGLLSLVLIGLWVGVWVASIRRDRLAVGMMTWTPPLPFLAGDFKVHIDHVARLQAAGIDPFHDTNDPICLIYPYPPMLGRLFAWVVGFETATAASLWQGALALILAAGGLWTWRTRRELGIGSIPPAAIVAAVLFSSPAVFAVERGQADPLVIVPIIASAWLLRRRAGWADLSCGALLGATAWLKYYPGLCVVALIVLGRRKALAAFVAVAALIGILDFEGTRVAMRQAVFIQAAMNGPHPVLLPWNHSLPASWGLVGMVHRSRVLRHVPGAVAAAFLLLPAVVLVSRKVARATDPSALIFPYLLWLTAAATYGMPAACDYNLTALPLALLSVWKRRDGLGVHVVLALSLLWLQPFWFRVDPEVLLLAKFATLYAVGDSLAACGSRAGRTPDQEADHLYRPAFARRRGRRRVPMAISGGPAPGSRSS